MTVEPVFLDFPSSFPLRAPTPRLRKDFNKNLPHMNPGALDDYVHPCIYDGNLDDLLHQGDFIDAILNQLADWLRKAAGGHLIDPKQGWEPVRRDDIEGWLVFDLLKMRTEIKKGAGNCLFPCEYFAKDAIFAGRVNAKSATARLEDVLKNLGYVTNPKGFVQGITVSILIWPAEKNIVARYLPESVRNVSELIERSREYHCAGNLEYRLRDIFRKAEQRRGQHEQPLRIPVILVVRRPFHLIGDNSRLEVLSYVVICKAGEEGDLDLSSAVLPLAHLDAVSPELLQRMSGTAKSQRGGSIVQLGCGSLGSKIVFHLARAGHGTFRLIDKGYLRPHNLARHALLTNGLVEEKSSALKRAIEQLGGTAETITDNLVERVNRGDTIVRKNTRLIVESTASLAVREALASLPPSRLPGVLMHTALYGGGELGLVAIEGCGRNPRVDDLMVQLFDFSIEDRRIAALIQRSGDQVHREPIGQGCGSPTMVMSDARVSMFATGMAEKANQILTAGAPEEGELILGFLEPQQLGVEWHAKAMRPVTSVRSYRGQKWEIRLLNNVAELISDEATVMGDVETGGVLIGHISWSRRCLTVSRTLPAPEDSERSPNCFILGTEGLKEDVGEIQTASSGLLTYVGTWHTHPSGGKPSKIDHNTLKRLGELRLGVPSIVLIWSPDRFLALVDEGDSENLES